MVGRLALACVLAYCFASAPAFAQPVSVTQADHVGIGDPNTLTGTSLLAPAAATAAGQFLVIGAPGGTPGRIYIHRPPGAGQSRTGSTDYPNSLDVITIISTALSDGFGRTLASGGVVNNFGAPNLAVGAPDADGGRGRVYLFQGLSFLSSTIADVARLVIRGAPGDALGSALAIVDLTGDGYAEIAIGAPGNNRVYVIKGGPSLSGVLDLTVTQPRFVMSADAVGDVLAAGDVTGDGFGDLLIGAPATNSTFLLRGRSSDNFGASLNVTDIDAILSGADAGDAAGSAIALLDLDLDDVRDIVIGAPGADGPAEARLDAGEVYVVWGGTNVGHRVLSAADVTIVGAVAGQRLGSTLANGQLTPDAYEDLAMLAPGAVAAGEVYAYYGRPRPNIGTVDAGGHRVVDLADPAAANRHIVGDPSHGPIVSLAICRPPLMPFGPLVAGVPTSSANSGRVFYTLAPQPQISPSPLRLTLNEGTRRTERATISNPTNREIRWEARAVHTWLTFVPSSGTIAPGGSARFDVSVDGSQAPLGSSDVPIFMTLTDDVTPMSLTLSVQPNVTAIRIGIDFPVPNATVPQPFSITGWAYDRRSATAGTNVTAVRIYADPNPGSGAPRLFLGEATYGLQRVDVAAAAGRLEASFRPGFLYHVPVLPQGRYRFLVFARSVSGEFSAVQELDVTLTAPDSPLDFSGDDTLDLIWQNQADGSLSLWNLVGSEVTATGPLDPSGVSDIHWKIVGTGDFNSDGKPDLIWQHRVHNLLAVWFMNGGALIDAVLLNPSSVSDPEWQVVAVADVNRDTHPDLIWHHRTRGFVSAWLMNGITLIDAVNFRPHQVPDTNWALVGAGDLNGDGNVDLLWRHAIGGWISVWLMDGMELAEAVYLNPATVPLVWTIRGLGDVNNDGNLDIIWQHDNGLVSIWYMRGLTLHEPVVLNVSAPSGDWTIVGPK